MSLLLCLPTFGEEPKKIIVEVYGLNLFTLKKYISSVFFKKSKKSRKKV